MSDRWLPVFYVAYPEIWRSVPPNRAGQVFEGDIAMKREQLEVILEVATGIVIWGKITPTSGNSRGTSRPRSSRRSIAIQQHAFTI